MKTRLLSVHGFVQRFAARFFAWVFVWAASMWERLSGFVFAAAELPPERGVNFGKRSTRSIRNAHSLAPFLKSLGYRGTDLHLHESLPHFQKEMDISDMRSALVQLGYFTHPKPGTPSEIDGRLLPCLFEIEESGDVLVVLSVLQPGLVFGYAKGAYRALKEEELKAQGTAYFARPVDAVKSSVKDGTWSSRLISRFQPHFAQLLTISFISNLLSIAVPLFVMHVYDRVIAHRAIDTLPMLAVGLTIVFAGDIYLKTLRAQLLGVIAARMDYLIGTATFGKLLRLPLSMTDGPPISSQVSRLREFQSIRDLFAGPGATAIIDFPFTILALIAVFVISGPLVLVPIAACGVFALAGYVGAQWLQGFEQQQAASSASLFNHITDSTLHHESIKREGGENVWMHRFRLLSADAASRAAAVQDQSGGVEAFGQFLNSAAALAVLLFGTLMILDDQLTVGALIATMAMTWRILGPAQQLFQTLGRLGKLRASIRSLDQMLNMKDEYDHSIPNLSRAPKQGRIALTRVNLRYGRDSEPAVANLNLTVPAGKMVAITGSNGAGKSSILRLVQGLYQPQGGVVSIDGADIRQLSPKVLRRAMSSAPQKLDVFYGTIAQNLRLGDPLASDGDLHAAVDEVGLLPAILALPEQFNTRIGDSSTNRLPPGFLRQLNIARALVRKAPVLLMDEPEAMLDDEGSASVQKLLERLRGQRTVLFVSHRPSFIKVADFAVFMRGGLIEFGGKPEGAVERLLGLSKSEKAA